MDLHGLLELPLDLFLEEVLPPSWTPLADAVLAAGVAFTEDPAPKWAAGWTPIPRTVRGSTYPEQNVRSAMYRTHDTLHQLWALPDPTQMDKTTWVNCVLAGEVATLTIIEFLFARKLLAQLPTDHHEVVYQRAAVNIYDQHFPGQSLIYVAREVGHALLSDPVPWWGTSAQAQAFLGYYRNMFRADRQMAEHNWELSQMDPPTGEFPPCRIPHWLGLEAMALWMVADFEELVGLGLSGDVRLYPTQRGEALIRVSPPRNIRLPQGWQS